MIPKACTSIVKFKAKDLHALYNFKGSPVRSFNSIHIPNSVPIKVHLNKTEFHPTRHEMGDFKLNPDAVTFYPKLVNVVYCNEGYISNLNPSAVAYAPSQNLLHSTPMYKNHDISIPRIIDISTPDISVEINMAEVNAGGDMTKLSPMYSNPLTPDLSTCESDDCKSIALNPSAKLSWATPTHDDPLTPNISVISRATANDVSPIHGNPQTPNTSTRSKSACDTVSHRLNPNAKPFIPTEVLNSRTAIFDNVIHSQVEMTSDEVSPHTVLQNLRLKNIDKIIIAHININSIRNKSICLRI